MKSLNYLGLIGSLMIIAGALSPMLHLPIVGTWNYYDIDVALASIVMTLAALGAIASLISKPGLLRFCGWASLIVILFTLAAVYFKVNDYFSFIPLKKLASAASRMVHYRWLGWIILLAGSILAIVGSRRRITVR
jgi:ABC-type Na+ efflux pump permease subunit